MSLPLATLLLFGAVACLGVLFSNDRFEYEYVRAHSDLATAGKYKLAAIWSGQEGSFLLWACMSGLFGLLALRSCGKYISAYRATIALFLAGLCSILIYESPFRLNMMHGQAWSTPDGAGLAPSLLNYWVIIHPPTIFAGFGSLIVLFAFAIAAMVHRDTTDWIPRVRPWALVAAALLGLGLCMGGFWAYETLGWGGFWAWDPVENTSLVPWLFAVVFIHGILVQSAKKTWRGANVLFAALPFLTFVYGTFLTRSGFLGDTSVHSFAEMDRSALYILIGIGLTSILGFVGLFCFGRWKTKDDSVDESVDLVSRRPMHAWGNFALIMLAVISTVGMSWPVIQSAFGQKPKVVEEWLYHAVVGYFFVPVMALMALTPFVSWRKTKGKEFGWRVYAIVCFTIGLAGLTMLIAAKTEWAGPLELTGTTDFPFGIKVPRMGWVLFLTAICYLVVVGSVWRGYEIVRRSKLGVSPFIAHFGLAVLLAGLILSRGLEQNKEFVVQEDGVAGALGYMVFAGKHTTTELTDRGNAVRFTLVRNGRQRELRPGLYYTLMGEEMRPMTWPAIARHGLFDEYLALHQMELNASEPTSIKPGETKKLDRFEFRYVRLTREGEAGLAGTKFGAEIEVKDTESGERLNIHPKVVLAQGALEQEPALIGDEFFVTLPGMDAASKAFTVQLHYRKPVYWAELFIKPFTPFVWIGTGILTLGTLMAAWYRRRPTSPEASSEQPEVVSPDTETIEEPT